MEFVNDIWPGLAYAVDSARALLYSTLSIARASGAPSDWDWELAGAVDESVKFLGSAGIESAIFFLKLRVESSGTQ